ncbi:MAG: trypsin-like peptidase domain-containing protein [Acidisphaera sp.]|nr:trypsin-like peptidase domain-containing protein [Acidisphaera sp.]MBV9811156.1 trypsin-like peptidase domain-containing protein [Acetobacteraceae bacterium]
MRLSRPPALVLAALLALTLTATGRASPPIAPGTQIVPDLVERLLPSVVNISILKQQREGSGTASAQGSEEIYNPRREVGSGFIIDPEGYVLTNRHVVEGAYKVSVITTDEVSHPAEVLSTNERPDLALLKIDAGHKLQAVTWGDSDKLRMGDSVIAIGNPLGLSSSVTSGVVSAVNRDLNETSIDDFIQTDAAINHGNSGGPLFNLQGEVIGVNTQLLSPTAGSSGLGLAIPSNDAMFVADQMRKYGKLRAGFLGVRLQQLSPQIAQTVGLPNADGGIVTNVFVGGPADAAQIQLGDVVLQIGDEETHDIRALLREIGAIPPGTSAKLRLWRDRAERTVNVTLAEWPAGFGDPAGDNVMPPRGARVTTPPLGLHAVDLTPELRQVFKLPSTQTGVLIEGVAANSTGADLGFARGDVVVRVGDDEVRTIDEVRDRVEGARKAGQDHVLMLVITDTRPHWIAVPTAPGA